MCKFIGKSNAGIFYKLSRKCEILRLYSIVHVAMETTKPNFTCQSKSFISIFILAKFQLVRCNPSLAMIWQMT